MIFLFFLYILGKFLCLKINLSYIKKFIQYYNIKSSQKKFIDFIKHRKNCISFNNFLMKTKYKIILLIQNSYTVCKDLTVY